MISWLINCSEYSLGFFRPGGVIPGCHEVDQLGVDIVPVIKLIVTNSIHISNNSDKIKPLLYSCIYLTLVSLLIQSLPQVLPVGLSL